jgi:hypothetical protein
MIKPPSSRGLVRFVTLLSLLSGAAHAASYDGPPVVPDKPIVFFNGKDVADLSQFYKWLGPLGHEDPNRVFTVVDYIDGGKAIRVSGEDWGGLVTHRAYANYKLVLEYRWGAVTWGSRKDRARNSGVLLHCQGEDGNYKPDFKGHWISSVEYEILEGRTGDIVLVSGAVRGSKEKITPRVTMTAQPGDFYWDPKGAPREFVSGQGHLHWFGRDRNWKDQLGFRGPRDLDKPLGEWNLVEAIADGDRLVYFLNGTKIMETSHGSMTHGRLLFQSEGAEIFFRRIELHPLPKN